MAIKVSKRERENQQVESRITEGKEEDRIGKTNSRGKANNCKIEHGATTKQRTVKLITKDVLVDARHLKIASVRLI